MHKGIKVDAAWLASETWTHSHLGFAAQRNSCISHKRMITKNVRVWRTVLKYFYPDLNKEYFELTRRLDTYPTYQVPSRQHTIHTCPWCHSYLCRTCETQPRIKHCYYYYITKCHICNDIWLNIDGGGTLDHLDLDANTLTHSLFHLCTRWT